MENVQDEEGEIVNLENINDTNGNKKQYRYRRLYDSVRQKSCFDKTLGSSQKWFFLLICTMQAMMIVFFVITFLAAKTQLYKS